MSNITPLDSRRYFMLPQAPEDAGYYAYGKFRGVPTNGASQFAHPSMMTAILRVENEWRRIDSRRFGVGDISLAGGVDHPQHQSHESGLEVDIRPVRKDGRQEPVTWQDSIYDFEATEKLIGLFHLYANARVILFNDLRIAFVKRAIAHDNHFHVQLWS